MNRFVLFGIIGAIIIVGGVLASPLFYDTEVDEPLPVVLNNIEQGLTLEKFSNMDDPMRQNLIDKMPQKVKDMIMDESATITRTISEEMDQMTEGDKMQSTEILKTGEFIGLAGHQANGLAKIIKVGKDSFLRFEDFEVTNGPDLRVYVTPNGDVHDGIHLEKLKGSRGSQNYSLENIDLDVYDTVVIYCQPFGVYFAEAKLM